MSSSTFLARMLRGLCLLPLLNACTAAVPKAASAKPAPDQALDRRVDVGGRAMHVHCVGDGVPLVVFDAGFGDDGKVWSKVLPEVGRNTRACAYDRLGLGSSSPAPPQHSVRQMVGELHQLLQAIAPGVPAVLVGHSFAGLTTRLYASEYPSAVAGLVLVDATNEEQDTRLWSLLPEEHLKRFRGFIQSRPEGLDFDRFREGMRDVRQSNKSLGNKPLVVLTAAKQRGVEVSPEVDARMAQVWMELQTESVRVSSNSVHVVTQQSGHYIHVEEPQLVIAAVREVVRASRTGTRVRQEHVSAQQ